MQRAVDLGKGPSVEPIMFLIAGQAQCALGRIQSSRQTFAQGVSSAQSAGLEELSAQISLFDAACLAEVGNPALARQVTLQALASSNDRDARVNAADTLARAGDTAGSQKLIDELAKGFPTDTMLNSVWLPVARATNQIRADQAAHAVTTLEAAIPYELGGPPGRAMYWPMHVRGEAYRLHDGAKAAAEYQKILDRRGVVPGSPLYPLARLGSGRAYALQGDKAKAKTAYQDFFAQWKDADPDVPILKEAKAEYAKLQ
jgi:hypothetical protein